MIASDIQFPKFPSEIYSRIALNDLVTYAVYFLSQNGGEVNNPGASSGALTYENKNERSKLRGVDREGKGLKNQEAQLNPPNVN